jgi:hypothetical protein
LKECHYANYYNSYGIEMASLSAQQIPANNIFLSVEGSNNQSIGSVFTTILMNKIVDIYGTQSSNYNIATGIFTVPTTGFYEITGTIRFQDKQIAKTQFGVGIHTSNTDGPWFMWSAIQGTTSNSNRTTYPYLRLAKFNAGDQVRMFSYVDTGVMPINIAAMQIRFLF